MGSAFRYWQLVTIDASGQQRTQEIASARAFFSDRFPQYTLTSNLEDAKVQQQLLELSQDQTNDKSCLAERCLLCFISWQIQQTCWQLQVQFGNAYGFTYRDLLPYVLDDDGNLTPTGSYQCLGRKILQTFDPTKSNLTNWVNIKVKQNPEINKFLLEFGIYRVTDWAILNDTSPKKLEQVLRDFHSLTPTEITYFAALFRSYTEIYKLQRLQQVSLGKKGICSQPTTPQLEQIAARLHQIGKQLDEETVLAELQILANYLREYRIYKRSGSLPTVEISQVEDADHNENSPRELWEFEEQNHQREFLELYRDQFLLCLEASFDIVLKNRVNKLETKKGDKAGIFLKALQLFHCQQMSMTEIAQSLGLRAQDAVTRLLKLKDFRADVQREFVKMLCDRVVDLAQNYSHPERIKQLEQELADIIHAQSTNLVREAEIKSRTVNNHLKNNLFSEKLCRYLDSFLR
jgi:hypothetical protein